MYCKKISLKLGARGDQVGEVQRCLQKKGYYKQYSVDNDYGRYTVREVKRFQSDNNLKDDGWFAELTCKKLNCNTPTKTKTSTKTAKKGTIQKRIESKIGTFTSFTGFYNKMIGRGDKEESGDTETLDQELSDLAGFNCSNATQVGVQLAREMGYTARFVHVKCKKSGGHVYGEIMGKEFGSKLWTKFDLRAAMNKKAKAPLNKGWCFDVTPISYNDAWLESDDGKT